MHAATEISNGTELPSSLGHVNGHGVAAELFVGLEQPEIEPVRVVVQGLRGSQPRHAAADNCKSALHHRAPTGQPASGDLQPAAVRLQRIESRGVRSVIKVLADDIDPDGDAFAAGMVRDAPLHRPVTVQADMTLLYVPGRDFDGSDIFVGAVSDGRLSDEASVTAADVDVTVMAAGGSTSVRASGGGRFEASMASAIVANRWSPADDDVAASLSARMPRYSGAT